ncbi:unnamed protein product [Discula destructiva]
MSSTWSSRWPYPAFLRNTRLATGTAEDVEEIAGISEFSIRRSQLDRYLRPHHFEGDHVPVHWYDEFDPTHKEARAVHNIERAKRNLLDPKRVVIVWAETLNVPKVDTMYGSVKRSVALGLAVLGFPEGSARIGQFFVKPEAETSLELFQDFDWKRLKIIDEIARAGCEKHRLDRMLIIEELVVHPSCRRSGKGSAMLHWCMGIAEADGLEVGAISIDTNKDGAGRSFFRKHGFHEVGDFQVPDDGDAKGFTYQYHVYQARGPGGPLHEHEALEKKTAESKGKGKEVTTNHLTSKPEISAYEHERRGEEDGAERPGFTPKGKGKEIERQRHSSPM